MKLFAGILTAGMLIAANAAQAQRLAPYTIGSPFSTVSDFERPYAATPDIAPWRYGPTLLPAAEIGAIARESGFSLLGSPQQRGFFYTVSVINREGDDGRLVIDGRTGRILRFMPAYRMSDTFNDDLTTSYGPVGPPPAIGELRGPSRPAAMARFASRTPVPPLPIPKVRPHPGIAKPLAAKPASAPLPQSAAVQPAKSELAAAPLAATVPAASDGAPASPPPIQPTQDMPQAQGLD